MHTVTPSRLLAVQETAERLAVSVDTIRRLIARGELPALKVGKQIRLDPSELERWVRS